MRSTHRPFKAQGARGLPPAYERIRYSSDRVRVSEGFFLALGDRWADNQRSLATYVDLRMDMRDEEPDAQALDALIMMLASRDEQFEDTIRRRILCSDQTVPGMDMCLPSFVMRLLDGSDRLPSYVEIHGHVRLEPQSKASPSQTRYQSQQSVRSIMQPEGTLENCRRIAAVPGSSQTLSPTRFPRMPNAPSPTRNGPALDEVVSFVHDRNLDIGPYPIERITSMHKPVLWTRGSSRPPVPQISSSTGQVPQRNCVSSV